MSSADSMADNMMTASFGERIMTEVQKTWQSLRFWQVIGITMTILLILAIVAFLLWWFLWKPAEQPAPPAPNPPVFPPLNASTVQQIATAARPILAGMFQ